MDVRDGRVVKGVNFKGIRDVSDPVDLAEYYYENGADELVFYDITASVEKRLLFTEVLKAVARHIFIPLTVGGGIHSAEDIDQVLKCGADKVSVNSGVIDNPDLIREAAKRYGNQCVVLSMDVKRAGTGYHLFRNGGREDTGIDAVEWAKMSEADGAGELVVNSIDTDGVRKGFDLRMLQTICENVSIPVIASGGAGNMNHFSELFHSVPDVDAALAASIFHFKEVKIPELKRHLENEQIKIRL
jgi:cyclase